MIQDDNKKAELFNDYFCKQADLNDSETSVPDITDIGYLSIDAASLRSLGFNRSGPIALDVSSIFNISSTSFSVTVICSRF
jgi:hypothetical protein